MPNTALDGLLYGQKNVLKQKFRSMTHVKRV